MRPATTAHIAGGVGANMAVDPGLAAAGATWSSKSTGTRGSSGTCPKTPWNVRSGRGGFGSGSGRASCWMLARRRGSCGGGGAGWVGGWDGSIDLSPDQFSSKALSGRGTRRTGGARRPVIFVFFSLLFFFKKNLTNISLVISI